MRPRGIADLLWLMTCIWLGAGICMGQTVVPEVLWAYSIEGKGALIRDLVTDEKENAFLIFKGSDVNLNNRTFIRTPTDSLNFSGILKVNPYGVLLWAQTNNVAYQSLNYNNGFLYSASRVFLELQGGRNDIVIQKHDRAGEIVWAKSFLCTGPAYIGKLESGGDGTLYLAGSFLGQLAFGNFILTTQGSSSSKGFLAMFDADGNILRARQFDDVPSGGVESVDVDKDGACYLLMWAASSAKFSAPDVWVVKVGVDAKTVWTKTIKGEKLETPLDMAINDAGQIVVTGATISPTINFGDGEIPARVSGSLNDDVVFVVKYSKEGNLLTKRVFPNIWLLKGIGALEENSLLVGEMWQYYNTVVQGIRERAAMSHLKEDGSPIWRVGVDSVANSSCQVFNTLRTPNGYYFTGQIQGKGKVGDVTIQPNSIGSMIYFLARATHTPPPPIILEHPKSLVLTVGDSAFFRVVVLGGSGLQYQWYKNQALIGSATFPDLTLHNIQPSDGGFYRVKITSRNGDLLSNVALLEVRPNKVLRLNASITTIAGSGTEGYMDSENGLAAQLSHPDGGAVGPNGTFYFVDGWNHCVRFVTKEGIVGTYAGRNEIGFKDGAGNDALFKFPLGLQMALNGDLLVADSENHRVRRIPTAGFRRVQTIAGSGARGYQNESVRADLAQFAFPNDVVEDGNGFIYVSEFHNHTIRKIWQEKRVDGWHALIVSTLAGNGTLGFADGMGTEARFNQIGGMAIFRGTLYVADWENHRIRKVTLADGNVTTYAGTGEAGWEDGLRTTAKFKTPNGLAVDVEGNLYVTDIGSHTIRMIRASDGIVNTLAGLGRRGFADGNHLEAMFNVPSGIAIADDGTLFVTDAYNHRVRKVLMEPAGEGATYKEATVTLDLNPGIIIKGIKGRKYRIESTESLESAPWINVGSIILDEEVQKWFDPRPSSSGKRLYRAVLME